MDKPNAFLFCDWEVIFTSVFVKNCYSVFYED